MKEILKQFRPFDYILIGLAVLLSFTPAVVTAFTANQTPSGSQLVAVVKINGEIVDKWSLDPQHSKNQEVTYYPNEGQYNIVQIKDGAIRVREDNSPDQIAVNTGWISKKGQILVCLPHQLIIEIQERGNDDDGPDDELILPI
ncbi:NusG domain II-containing protein [Streptococcus sp. X16XC17]|uniref:NusG domain II-containing protein n=1 Tax=unclassified Streptococcus TaxID=2608887 RepID=UPI00066FC199|nr:MULTISPECIES: NusG domain II-containing protein [unclassified Streptococcus]TCD46240.1 NusG domain II-containing protein [Streptococcus sp. X16XC17]